jgi:hypothetical protein
LKYNEIERKKLVNKMNLYLVFAALVFLSCNAQGSDSGLERVEDGRQGSFSSKAKMDLEDEVRTTLSNFIFAKDPKEITFQLAKLRELSFEEKNNYPIDYRIAEMANTLLSNDGFDENYTKKLSTRRNIDTCITLALVGALAWSFYNPTLHSFEKNSPLLALTGASIVGTCGAMLPDNLTVINTNTKLAVITVFVSVCWVIVCLLKPQEKSDPWDLTAILFPITSGITKRFFIDPSKDFLSKRLSHMFKYKPFKGGKNVS